MATAKASGTGTASWADALGVSSPELLDNSLTLVNGIYSASSADRLAAAGIHLASKVELFNLPSVGGTLSYDKAEGLTLRDDGSLVINYDNDFGTEGASGNAFTVVTFSNPAVDTEDSGDGGGYRPATNHDVYGLVMPDGLATFSFNGEPFILAAGEGDDRNDFLAPDETARVSALLTAAASAQPAQKAGLVAANAQRLNILTNTGDLDRDGIVDQAYTLGSRSLRIFDSKGNVVFDSGTALEELAVAKGVYPINSREDDKGVEPEMVEVMRLNGRTYAFVALERTTTSLAAIFDVSNPYAPVAVDPLFFPGAQRMEGITFLTSDSNASRGVIASSEGNDVVSVVDFPLPYRLQLLHLSDGEAGLLASQTAPHLAALVDGLDDTHANTLILAGGDNFIPSPFLNGGTDLSVRDELNAVTGSTISLAASTNHPIAAVDIAIHNLIGVEASTIGNHEFDLGPRVFRDAFTPGSVSGWVGAQFPYLSANLEFSGDPDLLPRFTNTIATAGLEEASLLKGRIVPSTVVNKNGEKIGLVGATTQILEQISSTGGVEVKGFAGDGGERDDMALLASQLQPVIDDLTAQGVNKVILLAHLQQINNEKALAPLLRGVDIILAAGSNTRLGDGNDQAVAFPGHAATFADTYPIVSQGADGAPTLIVNTDNEYTYLGRLVVDFDAQGRILPGSVDPLVSGAYAATAATVAQVWNVSEADLNTTAFAEGTKGENVQDLTDAVQGVISSKDGQVWGYTRVYLEGERALVRGEETNLGNLTADANLAHAKSIDPTVVLSLKNGGGIRSQIGAIDVLTGEKKPPAANPSANKTEGGISTLDIENSLRFNNSLSLLTVTASQLRQLLEHGVANYPNQGRFPQVSGVAFSFDPSRAVGNRIVNMTLEDSSGGDLDLIVRNGSLYGDPNRTFRMVTLNFLAGGGDGYPFPTGPAANRLDLYDPAAPRTGLATFAGDGTEQDVLAEYLATSHGSLAQAYNKADTAASLDGRLQNLALRADSVVDAPTLSITPLAADRPEGSISSTPFTFLVNRSGDPSVPVSVSWSLTASGPASADALDFAGGAFPSGSILLPAGQTSQVVGVHAIGDSTFEADESFSVSLHQPQGASLLAGSTSAMGRIRNDDAPGRPLYTFSQNAETVEEGGVLALGLTTANLPAGTRLFWQLSGAGITAADVSDGQLSGDILIGRDGRAGFTKTIAVDLVADPREEMEVRFYNDASRRQQVGSTLRVTLLEPTVGLVTDGSDSIIGSGAAETLVGVPGGSVLRGRGSLDRLTGGGGADLFVLGNAAGTFYDDGTSGLGTTDLAVITDFSSADTIQLYGRSTDYTLVSGRHGGIRGVRIDALLSGTAEAIGFVQGATLPGLNLADASQFTFV
jgi:2',3'-cyclic-nucleotide 2'-phosphodiesterase (5'-nucleotidase family)